MLPSPYRIIKRRKDLADVFTVDLEPVSGTPMRFLPGQFNMLYVFGVGEVPISISGDPSAAGPLVHTVRSVGAVTQAMAALKPGAVLGVRGPFGKPWPVEVAYGMDVVIVAGGLGLAPVRPLILSLLAERGMFGRFLILYGARKPEDVLFEQELHAWRSRFDVGVKVTVDRAAREWQGRVGVVPKLVDRADIDPDNTIAFVCGPEVMMTYTVEAFERKGLPPAAIYLSMERNMKCALGFCGHCQYGGSFVCKDGPVFRFDTIRDRYYVPET